MGGQNNWRTGITGEDWMRGMEKRVLHEERRPQIRTASDILGPGIAPYCIRIEDWNAPETLFNGFWYSEPGAFNAPKSDRYWIGYSLAIEGGWGIERVTEYFGDTTDVAWPRQVWVRKFWTDTPDALRQWSAWRIEDNTPPGIISEYGGSSVVADARTPRPATPPPGPRRQASPSPGRRPGGSAPRCSAVRRGVDPDRCGHRAQRLRRQRPTSWSPPCPPTTP